MPETACLHIRAGDTDPIRVVEIPGVSVRIGRASYCEVRLPEPDLADEECRLKRRQGIWHLVPTRPSGAVSMDGHSVASSCPLPFDVPFRIGTHWLTLRPTQASAPDWESYQGRPPIDLPKASAPAVDNGWNEPRTEARAPSENVRPAGSIPAAPDSDHLERWRERHEQSASRLRLNQAERRWEERWKAAGERIRSRDDAKETSTPPSAPKPTTPLSSDNYRARPIDDPASRTPSTQRIREFTSRSRSYEPRPVASPVPPSAPPPRPSIVPVPTAASVPPIPVATPPARLQPAPPPSPVNPGLEAPEAQAPPVTEPEPSTARALMIPFVEPVTEPTAFVPPQSLDVVEPPGESPESDSTEPEVVLEARIEPEIVLESEPEPEPESEFVPEAVVEPEPVLEASIDAEIGVETATDAEAEAEEEVEAETAADSLIMTSDEGITIEPAPAANRPARELRPPIVIELPPQSHRLTSDAATSEVPEAKAADSRTQASPTTRKVDPSRRAGPQSSATAKAGPETGARRDRGLFVADTRSSGPKGAAPSSPSTSGPDRKDTEAPSSRRNGRKTAPPPLEDEPRRSPPPNSKLAPDLLAPPGRKVDDANPKPKSTEESAREWPRASDIFAAHHTAPPRVAPAHTSARKVLREPTPTESREPASWRLPLWLGWFPLVVAALGVGTVGFVAARAWTRDASSTGVVANALARPGEAKPLPEGVEPPPIDSWWRSSGANLALWAAYFERRAAADPSEDERARAFTEAALKASPFQAQARFAQARRPSIGEPPNPLLVGMGLSHDVVTLAWTGHQWLKAGKKDVARKFYREALEMASRADLSRLGTPILDNNPQAPRYHLPGEELIGLVVRDMAADETWTFDEWSEALPSFAPVQLATARILVERGGNDAEKLLESIVGRKDEPAPAGFPAALHIAAVGEALAMKSRPDEALQKYRQAIDLMPDDLVKRSWWLNVADLASKVNDESEHGRALDAARGHDTKDEIARHAQDLLSRDGGRRPSATSPR